MINLKYCEMDIGAIIGDYIYLKPFGEDFVGRCPFCLAHAHSLVVIPHLKTYECVHCGQAGGAIDFIKNIEHIIKWEYQRSLKQEVREHTIGTVYVLSLEGGRFYIGFTQDLQHRLTQHFEHKGALWTQRFQPLRLIDVYYDVPEFVEHRVTRRYIERYGADKVRGGWHISAQDLSKPYERYPKRNPYQFKSKLAVA
jgi:hypothetical protein